MPTTKLVRFKLRAGTTTARLAATGLLDREPWFDTDLDRLFIWKASASAWRAASPDLASYTPDFATAAVSTAGTTSYQPALLKQPASFALSVGAGAGSPFTRVVVLPVATGGGAAYTAGEKRLVCVSFPPSPNPTIELRNSTSGGTLLARCGGSGEQALQWWVECVFSAGAWQFQRSGFSPTD